MGSRVGTLTRVGNARVSQSTVILFLFSGFCINMYSWYGPSVLGVDRYILVVFL